SSIDFSCGFQVSLLSGTRSKNLRVFANSSSNSANNLAEVFICGFASAAHDTRLKFEHIERPVALVIPNSAQISFGYTAWRLTYNVSPYARSRKAPWPSGYVLTVQKTEHGRLLPLRINKPLALSHREPHQFPPVGTSSSSHSTATRSRRL